MFLRNGVKLYRLTIENQRLNFGKLYNLTQFLTESSQRLVIFQHILTNKWNSQLYQQQQYVNKFRLATDFVKFDTKDCNGLINVLGYDFTFWYQHFPIILSCYVNMFEISFLQYKWCLSTYYSYIKNTQAFRIQTDGRINIHLKLMFILKKMFVSTQETNSQKRTREVYFVYTIKQKITIVFIQKFRFLCFL